jgi:hypothetical protein
MEMCSVVLSGRQSALRVEGLSLPHYTVVA